MPAGEVRGNNATQNSTTRVQFNNQDSDNETVVTPEAPGIVTIREVETTSNFYKFSYTAVGTSGDQIELEGSVSASSASNPFSDNDSVTLSFQFNGSDGSKGQKGQDGASVKGQKGEKGEKGEKGQKG